MNLAVLLEVLFVCIGLACFAAWIRTCLKRWKTRDNQAKAGAGVNAPTEGVMTRAHHSPTARAYAAHAISLHAHAEHFWGIGAIPEACSCFQRAIKLAQLSGDHLLLVSLLSKFADFQQTNDLLFEAEALLDRATSILLHHSEHSTYWLRDGVSCQRQHLARLTALSKNWRMVGLLLRNEPSSQAAEGEARKVLSELQGSGWDDWRVAGIINLLACAVAARGNWYDARQHWEQARCIISEWPYCNPALVENIDSNLAICRKQMGW